MFKRYKLLDDSYIDGEASAQGAVNLLKDKKLPNPKTVTVKLATLVHLERIVKDGLKPLSYAHWFLAASYNAMQKLVEQVQDATWSDVNDTMFLLLTD